MVTTKKYTITLIPGDGIGPEVTSAAQKVIAAAQINVDWEIADAGEGAIEKHGTTLPDSTLDSIFKEPKVLGFNEGSSLLKYKIIVNINPNTEEMKNNIPVPIQAAIGPEISIPNGMKIVPSISKLEDTRPILSIGTTV